MQEVRYKYFETCNLRIFYLIPRSSIDELFSNWEASKSRDIFVLHDDFRAAEDRRENR